ncbi:MAG: accessory factor associated with RNA polymerase II [Vezdaea aestivalis]|nr:MAG: accessory factor associated with RNA polymerase II [Vezdaea aestivalis]
MPVKPDQDPAIYELSKDQGAGRIRYPMASTDRNAPGVSEESYFNLPNLRDREDCSSAASAARTGSTSYASEQLSPTSEVGPSRQPRSPLRFLPILNAKGIRDRDAEPSRTDQATRAWIRGRISGGVQGNKRTSQSDIQTPTEVLPSSVSTPGLSPFSTSPKGRNVSLTSAPSRGHLKGQLSTESLPSPLPGPSVSFGELLVGSATTSRPRARQFKSSFTRGSVDKYKAAEQSDPKDQQSTTSLVLESVTGMLRHLEDLTLTRRKHDDEDDPYVPSSPHDTESRFGYGNVLATLSKSSSERNFLQGKVPQNTPQTSVTYRASDGQVYNQVNITNPRGPSYLPSEARRITTPPTLGAAGESNRVRGFFFDYNNPEAPDGKREEDTKSHLIPAIPKKDRLSMDVEDSWFRSAELEMDDVERELMQAFTPPHRDLLPIMNRSRVSKNFPIAAALKKPRNSSASSSTLAHGASPPIQPNNPIGARIMASNEVQISDALYCLRGSIAAGSYISLSASAEQPAAGSPDIGLATATFLHFTTPILQSFPLSTETRFVSSEKAVDLRSVYFTWLKKDLPIPQYIEAAQQLNEELTAAGGAGGTVRNLVFVEKLDLITWLEGASEESDYIKPLENDASVIQASGNAAVASGAAGGIPTIPSSGSGARGRVIDPRLAEIYNGERSMGDRNSVLRGIKPSDFSHVRKAAEAFIGKSRTRPGAATNVPAPTKQTLPRRPGRRTDPIILLSPSASSLLRMTNVKSFLDSGTFVPADSALAGPSSTNLLHISRILPTIDGNRPFRFNIVDTPENFRLDYWDRVVAVFTTGQTWQFSSYKWREPPDLFRNVLGIYVGWKGDQLPANVKSWGRGVKGVHVDKWSEMQGTQGRWRDREVVESVWGAIEDGMRSKGWGKEGGPLPS